MLTTNPDPTTATRGMSDRTHDHLPHRCRTRAGRPAWHKLTTRIPVGAAGRPGDLGPDDGGLHDAHRAAGVAVGALVGVQAVPRLHVDVPVLLVVAHVHRVGWRPGGRVGAGEPVAVAARPATLAWVAWWGRGEELPVVADTRHDLDVQVGQPDGELDRVEAGVEGEQRCQRAGFKAW